MFRLPSWLRGSSTPEPSPADLERLVRLAPVVPHLALVPLDLHPRLARLTGRFLATHSFHGCRGFAIEHWMTEAVAVQACLLLLGRPGESVFPQTSQVLIYRGSWIRGRRAFDDRGNLMEAGTAWDGESWSDGPVVLSWRAVEQGLEAADDGWNVVLHEYAHQLDHENGGANGVPAVGGRAATARWGRTMDRAWSDLKRAVEHREDTLLDPYALENPAEFFAVVSETFFELGDLLKRQDPDLYAVLAVFYGVDPDAWLSAVSPDSVQTGNDFRVSRRDGMIEAKNDPAASLKNGTATDQSTGKSF